MGRRSHYIPKDKAYHRAKQEGYASRAAFKLKEVQERWHILQAGDLVLDLGAAPGSWSQYALEQIGPKGVVVGVDLERVANFERFPNFQFVQEDLLQEAVSIQIQNILARLERPAFDVILSDLSPKLSGITAKDHADSLNLGEIALRYAVEFLHGKGRFLVKLFPGPDLADFRRRLEQVFRESRLLQLNASRRTSREIYLLGMGKRT